MGKMDKPSLDGRFESAMTRRAIGKKDESSSMILVLINTGFNLSTNLVNAIKSIRTIVLGCIYEWKMECKWLPNLFGLMSRDMLGGRPW